MYLLQKLHFLPSLSPQDRFKTDWEVYRILDLNFEFWILNSLLSLDINKTVIELEFVCQTSAVIFSNMYMCFFFSYVLSNWQMLSDGLTGCSTGWLIDWLFNWLTHWLIVWLTYRLTDWLVNRWTFWPVNWLID